MKWRTGRPEKDGEYIITNRWNEVRTILFTTDGGWNTARNKAGELSVEHKLKDDYVRGWLPFPDPMPETPYVVWSE